MLSSDGEISGAFGPAVSDDNGHWFTGRHHKILTVHGQPDCVLERSGSYLLQGPGSTDLTDGERDHMAEV